MKRYILLTIMGLLTVASIFAQADRQYLRSGNRQFREQNYVKAEAEYRKAVTNNPRNAQAIYNLGCALMMQQKDSAAVEQYENAGKLETSKLRKSKSYHNIGVICQRHQMYGEAIQAYEESLRNNPSDDETRYNLALCKRLQKKQPQNKDKNQQQKDDKKQEDKNQNKKDKNKDKQKEQEQPKEQMSKENAEQLLNAAMQEEKATQQRLKKAMQQPHSRNLQKNW